MTPRSLITIAILFAHPNGLTEISLKPNLESATHTYTHTRILARDSVLARPFTHKWVSSHSSSNLGMWRLSLEMWESAS